MAKFNVKIKDCQLIIKVKMSFSEKINDSQLDYFSKKFLRGFLKVKSRKKNQIEYYGPLGISLFERLNKPVNKYDFLFMVEQVVDATQKVNANSLIIGNVLWDIHNVYINETTKELQFIYLPLENVGRVANIIGFLEQIVYSAKPSQEDDMDYISRFIYFLRSASGYNADQIEKFILKEDKTIVSTIKSHSVSQSGFMTDKPQHYYEHYREKESCEEATGLLCEEEATGLLNEEEATGLLNPTSNAIRYGTMLRILTNETFEINKPVFRIGKERSYSDYFVSNNNTVSRSHADIVSRNGKYYIVDLNSKNGTYVNELAIPAQQEVEINDGDKIKLANEEFEFRV